jgi:hypothetical protein
VKKELCAVLVANIETKGLKPFVFSSVVATFEKTIRSAAVSDATWLAMGPQLFIFRVGNLWTEFPVRDESRAAADGKEC